MFSRVAKNDAQVGRKRTRLAASLAAEISAPDDGDEGGEELDDGEEEDTCNASRDIADESAAAVGEEEDYGGLGGAEVEEEPWDEAFMDPLTVRFTQDKVHPFFYRRGPIVHVLPKIRPIERSLDRGDNTIEEVVDLIPPFAPIHCLKRGEDYWSLDNRRLYALQLVAMDQWPKHCRVKVLCRDRLPRYKFKNQYRKFNTKSEGRIVSIAARYQQFDTWSWFERAVEIEWYHLSQVIGIVLAIFEALPLVGALLFRTGLTGFSTRWPFAFAFAAAFLVEVLRQKQVSPWERSLAEYQVLAVMKGEVSLSCPNPGHQVWEVLRRMRYGKQSEDDDEEELLGAPLSAPLRTAVSTLIILLTLPYLVCIGSGRLRSSAISCWLGVACVLAVQLLSTVRLLRSKDTTKAIASLSGTAPIIGPSLSSAANAEASEDTG